MPTVLVSAISPPPDACELLVSTGFEVVDHLLGATRAIDFSEVAVAVVEVGAKPDAAAAQTRRWRAELRDDLVPVVWVLPESLPDLACRGLDAGADAVLARPLDPAAFIAQVRSAARARATATRVLARASEARLLGDQLQKAYARIDRDLAAARRVRRALLPPSLPAVGAARFAVAHRPRGRAGGDFYDAVALDADRAGFFIADAVEAAAAGGLLGVFLGRSVALGGADAPGEILAEVNRELLGLGFEDPPLVAMLAGVIDGCTGELQLARAGLPAPVYVPTAGELQAWAIPGPFLGTADTTYPTHRATLRPGDKLVLATDGSRPDGSPNPSPDHALFEAATRHRELSGQAFADAVARDLLAAVTHDDDFTLMVVEMVGV